MTTAAILKKALRSLERPVWRIVCRKKTDEYFVFQLIAGLPTEFADDDNLSDESTWRITYYTKKDFSEMIPEIKRVLKEAEFYGITLEMEGYEQDTHFFKVSLEAKYLEG